MKRINTFSDSKIKDEKYQLQRRERKENNSRNFNPNEQNMIIMRGINGMSKERKKADIDDLARQSILSFHPDNESNKNAEKTEQ